MRRRHRLIPDERVGGRARRGWIFAVAAIGCGGATPATDGAAARDLAFSYPDLSPTDDAGGDPLNECGDTDPSCEDEMFGVDGGTLRTFGAQSFYSFWVETRCGYNGAKWLRASWNGGAELRMRIAKAPDGASAWPWSPWFSDSPADLAGGDPLGQSSIQTWDSLWLEVEVGSWRGASSIGSFSVLTECGSGGD